LESSNSNSKIKVSFFSALPPFRGGIASFSELLIQQLKKISEVSAFTFRKQYPDFLFPGKTQYSEKTAVNFPRIVSAFNPFTYWKAAYILRKSDSQIFITNYWMTFFGPMMAFFAFCLKKKSTKIALIHNLIPHEKRFFDTFFNRIFLSQYDGFVVLSEAVKNDVLTIKKNANCIVLKHPPYGQFGEKKNQTAAQIKLGLDPSKKTLLFFGLIRDYKGLDVLLKAFSFLESDFQLLIAGEVYGSEKKYTDLIDISKNKNILFKNDFIPDEEVVDYFSAADLCVLPYKSATQSGIKAIADSFGVPVLTTKVGGLAEEILDKQNGFIIESTNELVMSKQITTLFKDNSVEKVQLFLDHSTFRDENKWFEFAQLLMKFASELKSEK
jgi:glycosyltransferase involved in cell wall biosynthesis